MSLRASGDEGSRFTVDEAAARRVVGEGEPALLSGEPGDVLVTKEGETFCISARNGDVEEGGALGLYHRDTRFLSRFTLRLGGTEPVLLSAEADAYLANIDLTNPDLVSGDRVVVPQQAVHIRRTRVTDRRLHERLRVKNHARDRVRVPLEISLASDFFDIFEVRGLRRTRRGTILEPKAGGREILLGYLGRDGLFRRTRIRVSQDPAAAVVRANRVVLRFLLDLRPQSTHLLDLTVEPLVGEGPGPEEDFDPTLHRLGRSYEDWEDACTRIFSDEEVFDELCTRGRRDARMLWTPSAAGGVFAAGIPWYVAPRGRTAALAANGFLFCSPQVGAETLRFLARYQGRRVDDWRDEQPGRILHELRQGELAFSDVLPYAPYYGSVDATPIFCMLAAAHHRWTGDLQFLSELRPSLEAALDWIDSYGGADGFVAYEPRSPRGLTNQGWKDSASAVVHPDGRPARPPVALSEVQAYVYLAKRRLATVFERLGDPDRARGLWEEARLLRERFNEAFWMPDEGYFALALDAEGTQVETITSNPAHGLYCGIVDEAKADAVARRLLAPDMFSGWGIRTMSKREPAYNPVSYHNGSVWPHDNAIIAAGLKRYGFGAATERVATAMFDCAIRFGGRRLPELFCGFTRRGGDRPVAYPAACSPHAWSATSIFVLLQAMLGISAAAHDNLLTVTAPSLPGWLERVEVRGLRVGASRLSLLFTRAGEVTSFSVLSKTGDVRVVVEE